LDELTSPLSFRSAETTGTEASLEEVAKPAESWEFKSVTDLR